MIKVKNLFKIFKNDFFKQINKKNKSKSFSINLFINVHCFCLLLQFFLLLNLIFFK